MAQIAIAAPVSLGARTARAPRPVSGPLRLTRRGRLLLIGLPVMLLAAGLMLVVGAFTAPVVAGSGAPEPVRATTVPVAEGDSLWSIAAEVAPEREPRAVIAEIAELNNLDGSSLVPGQQLLVPVGS